jgi:hypothetical protein
VIAPDLVIHHHRHRPDTLVAIRRALLALAESCAGDTGWSVVDRWTRATVVGPMHTTSFRHDRGRVIEVGRMDGSPTLSLGIDGGNGSEAIVWTIDVPQATDCDPATHVALAHAARMIAAIPDLPRGGDGTPDLDHWGRGVVAHMDGLLPRPLMYILPPSVLRDHPGIEDGGLVLHDDDVDVVRHPETARIAAVSPTVVSVNANQRFVSLREAQYSHDVRAAAADPMGTLRALGDLRRRLGDAA